MPSITDVVCLSSSCWTQGPTWRAPRSATDRRARPTLRCSWPQQQVGKHTHTHTHTYAHTYAHTVQHKAQLMLGCCPTYSRSVFGSDLWKLNYHLLLNYTGRKSVEGSSEGRDEWIKAAVTNHLITALTIQVSQPVQPFLQKHRIVLWMTHRPEEWGNERVKGRRSESSAALPVVV